MQKELATILKNKLISLPFAHVVAGIAQVLTDKQMNSDNTVEIINKRPVSYDVYKVGGESCEGIEISLVPDSTRRSIIYFEDYGISATGTLRGLQGYTSNLRLVCWLDRSKLVGNPYGEISGRCMAAVVAIFNQRKIENIGIFTRLQTEIARIPPQDPAIFGRYTYDETDRQYLRPPFEFFAIDIVCKFFVPNKCLSEIPWNVEVCS